MVATGSSDGEAATQWAALAGVTAALAMFGAAQGLSYPLFTLLMQRQGMSPALIGLSAAMMPVGLILSAAFVPAAVRLVGARNLAVGCSLAGALCFLTIGYLQDWVAWFIIRFLVGVVINPLYVLGEVWALSLAPPTRRGRVMGVFNTLLGAGYAAGPLILITVGTSGWPPFVAAISGFALCALILRAVSSKLTGFEDDGQVSGGIVGFAKLAPALLLAVLVAAAVQQSTYALMPVFGTGYGLPEATLAALVTALSAGNILLQIPLGLMAERFGGRAMIVFCALATAACALSLPLLITTPLVWPVLVVMGAVGYGVYTMALVELGSRFKGTALVAGNAAFALMWGAGGIVGPPGAGALMQGIGPLGLPAVIAGLDALLIAFALYRSSGRRNR
ncbi:MAG: MFS transporter [Mesorhizobium sp.]|uniref:MFS transporter n=2 Tax=Mesorhizobium TaxID=68287 RepID=UPI000F74FAAC|nr:MULTISPECIES: MFS transporter [unclassified Mesorhizobium]RUU43582.1 MFS transporter [Mesorhizobium sp. M6A.T.Ca.TU.002.02.2.1]AZO67827.1 MFS transporter [Mesorhizobium sp. M6A.T.Cr.TU.016.01.1.1]RUU26585.1 MFS transporter [Mesorhizobium sp. M6A.T.Ce.TU.016.01.1.1]RUV03755.1 MFS transporter [Mesorhizobium sp. M6A.T.Cr.TU.017.01.1.1]RWN39079.1 MAG: MFS transporter [Mesorhizobium sp.]